MPKSMKKLSIFSSPRGRTIGTPEVKVAQQWITSWLNAERDFDHGTLAASGCTSESRGRVLSLLSYVSNVTRIRITAEDPRQSEQWITFDGITAQMEKYPVFPSLAYLPGSKRWGVIRALPKSSQYPAGEALAAHGIIELARNSLLDRVKACACGRWFFANNPLRVACSVRCRQLNWEKSPEVLKRRKRQAKANAEYNSGRVHVRGK